MSLITFDQERCNNCGICVQSCPIAIIGSTPAEKTPYVHPQNESRCVNCGHCQSVCPSNAVIHQLSAQAQLQTIEGPCAIEPSQLAAHFKNRRSIRQYHKKQAEQTVFEQILDIVRYAPTGTNRQMNRWVIISNPTLIAQLTESTINWMRLLMTHKPEFAQRLNAQTLIAAFERGYDPICRNAPHLAICYTPATHTLGTIDAATATAHFELVAPSFGLGTCWGGYLMLALQNSADTKKLINLDETATVHSTLMVGYPKFRYHRTPQRNDAQVVWL